MLCSTAADYLRKTIVPGFCKLGTVDRYKPHFWQPNKHDLVRINCFGMHRIAPDWNLKSTKRNLAYCNEAERMLRDQARFKEARWNKLLEMNYANLTFFGKVGTLAGVRINGFRLFEERYEFKPGQGDEMAAYVNDVPADAHYFLDFENGVPFKPWAPGGYDGAFPKDGKAFEIYLPVDSARFFISHTYKWSNYPTDPMLTIHKY